MLKIHTKDGQTATLDLADGEQARAWLKRAALPAYQERLTGLTLIESHVARAACDCGRKCLCDLGVQISVPRPRGFRRVELAAEHVAPAQGIRGGERTLVYCDNVVLSVMAHAEQPAIRIMVTKLGTRVHNPFGG